MTVAVSALYYQFLDQLEVPDQMLAKLRRSDDFIRMAVTAAYHAFAEGTGESRFASPSDIPGSIEPEVSCGLILGTSFGTMQTNFDVLEAVVSSQQTSPTLFSHSVFNSAIGYIGSLCSINGPPLTITDFTFPFYRALKEAELLLLSESVNNCLVLQVETYSDLFSDARSKHRTHHFSEQPWRPGVVAWLLTKENPPTREENQRKGRILEKLHIEDSPFQPTDILDYAEEIRTENNSEILGHPLASAIELSKKLQSREKRSATSCEITAKWGKVKLSFAGS